jgi:phosphopantothenate synthetase
MSERRFQDVWVDQCTATRRIRDDHGVKSAFDYLVGEKLMTFADAAATRPEFARELTAVRCRSPAHLQLGGNSRALRQDRTRGSRRYRGRVR